MINIYTPLHHFNEYERRSTTVVNRYQHILQLKETTMECHRQVVYYAGGSVRCNHATDSFPQGPRAVIKGFQAFSTLVALSPLTRARAEDSF